MNQTQRQFLIKKIQDAVNARCNALESSKDSPPSINIWLLHAVLGNNFELKSIEEIKKVILERALKSTEREDWLGNHWGSASKNQIVFNVREIFVIPEEFEKKWEEYNKNKKQIETEVHSLRVQADSLITRIQLASDKTLQTMINEVDDMGNISLMDTKIKLLTNG